MKFQKTFAHNIKTVYKNDGIQWLENLPSVIEMLNKQWNFRFLKEVPDLSYSFVALVERLETKQHAIFKIAPTQNSLEKEVHMSSPS